MVNESIPSNPYGSPINRAIEEEPESSRGAGIEQLFGQRTSILKTKLEVFASELFERLRIREQNIQGISEDHERLTAMIEKVTRQADYHLRDRQDTTPLHEQQFQLQEQRREQDVSCWRDTVDVMRDFLLVWEA